MCVCNLLFSSPPFFFFILLFSLWFSPQPPARGERVELLLLVGIFLCDSHALVFFVLGTLMRALHFILFLSRSRPFARFFLFFSLIDHKYPLFAFLVLVRLFVCSILFCLHFDFFLLLQLYYYRLFCPYRLCCLFVSFFV